MYALLLSLIPCKKKKSERADISTDTSAYFQLQGYSPPEFALWECGVCADSLSQVCSHRRNTEAQYVRGM
jgi:hypothetical protein